MSRATVAVVVPVYNAERTLDRCVQSVLRQQLPGTLQCILVDDGSPDRCGAMCDAYATQDARVQVIHKEDGGVSSARNAGLALADADYIVFLDSDDALCPGALSAALAAQTAAPDAVVLWQYTTDAALQNTVPVPPVTAQPRPQSALARLYLDCVIAMPWNKLYRADLAQQLRFDESYTLGEDLQYVLDYLALLGRTEPQYHFALLEAPLCYYDCTRGDGTLSTRYHPEYCDIWPEHYTKLNAACTALGSPAQDLLPLYRAELRVFAEGVADILWRDPLPLRQRRTKARAAVRHPWLRAHLDTMRQAHCYSAYYLPLRWRSVAATTRMAALRKAESRWFGRFDWAGYYLLGGHWNR